MKIFFAEAKQKYSRYFFPYQVLLWADEGDQIGPIYQNGFLPFRHRKNWFYLARSSRCRLDNFSLSSENRRILKKTNSFLAKKLSLKDFSYSPQVQKKCKEWSRERGWKISTLSLKYIFSGQFFNRVWLWYDQEKENALIGYQIIYEEREFIHAAHIFYHPDYYRRHLGTRMLLEASIWAAKEGKKFHYLGTCYGKTGFYKRSFPGFEFFNGFSWSSNVKELEYLNQREGEEYLFRESDYWRRFYPKKEKEKILLKKGIKIRFSF